MNTFDQTVLDGVLGFLSWLADLGEGAQALFGAAVVLVACLFFHFV